MSAHARFVFFLVLLLTCLGVSAQITGEPMEGRSRNHDTHGSGNVFGCPTTGNAGSPPCDNGAGGTIAYRFYSPDPASNGGVNVNPLADGNPIYVPAVANGVYVSDIDNSANYFGAGHAPLLPMNLVWDGQLRGGTGDHAGYYAAQSQLITENGEVGGTNNLSCTGTRGIACFSAANGLNQEDPTDAPQGTVPGEGGMKGVPVPIVTSINVHHDATLSWLAPTNEYITDGAPAPIQGVDLYVLASTSPTKDLDSRSVTDLTLDAGAQLVGFFPKGTTSAIVDFDADLPAGTTQFIPALRVVYSDNDGDPAQRMASRWSANGPVIDTQGILFTEVVNFAADYLGRTQGRHVAEISWETVAEDGLEGFVLRRGASPAGPFVRIAEIPRQGTSGEGSVYRVQDVFREPGSTRELFYELTVIENNGTDSHVGPVRMSLERAR